MIINQAIVHNGLGDTPRQMDVAVRDGKIAEINDHLVAKEGEPILEASGYHLYPGFIDPWSQIGARNFTFRQHDTDEASEPLTPLADVYYALSAPELKLENLPSVGITSIGVAPGSVNILGGQIACFHTGGGITARDLLLKRKVAVRGSVASRVKETYGERNITPMTRMGIYMLLKEFFKSKHVNPEMETIKEQLLTGEVPLWLEAYDTQDLSAAMEFLAEFPKIRYVFLGAFQYAPLVERMIAAGVPLIIGDQINLSKATYDGLQHLPSVKLLEAGIPVSFSCTGEYGANGRVHYSWNMARFLEHGMPPEQCLTMMTSAAAKLLGISEITGSVEEGKLADLVLCSDDYLTYYGAQILITMIAGDIVYEREQTCL